MVPEYLGPGLAILVAGQAEQAVTRECDTAGRCSGQPGHVQPDQEER